ncbi:MAG: methylamine dehydrogenase [Alphaproteobacteria bacterium]|nr:MAG: methylamine dehydrogenase [Alphaproteobacteria bacterium]
MQALMISQILSWILLVGLGLVCLALARQVGVLHERIAPAGALAINGRLKVGDTAPHMTVETLDGTVEAIGGARAKSQLLFFLSPECPLCKTLLPVVRALAGAERKRVDIVLASDGDAARHAAFRASQKLGALPYVLSEALGRAYGVAKLPYAVLIDEQGAIAAMGLVNSREHLESLLEAKDRGVASLQDYLDGRAHGRPQPQRISA